MILLRHPGHFTAHLPDEGSGRRHKTAGHPQGLHRTAPLRPLSPRGPCGEWEALWYKIIYLAPERIESTDFLPKTPLGFSAFTATAASQVHEGIIHLLRLQNPFTITTGFDRPHLYFCTPEPRDKALAPITQLKQGLLRNHTHVETFKNQPRTPATFLNPRHFEGRLAFIASQAH